MQKALELRPGDAGALPYIGEYNKRKMLHELGFKFDPSELSDHKAECFAVIAGAYQDRQEEKAKKPKPKPRRR